MKAIVVSDTTVKEGFKSFGHRLRYAFAGQYPEEAEIPEELWQEYLGKEKALKEVVARIRTYHGPSK